MQMRFYLARLYGRFLFHDFKSHKAVPNEPSLDFPNSLHADRLNVIRIGLELVWDLKAQMVDLLVIGFVSVQVSKILVSLLCAN